MADVFLSYKNTPERKSLVRRLALILRANGISVWWDYGLEAGQAFQAEIERQLAGASLVVPLWCRKSIYSEWVRREATLGEKKLAPAKLQSVRPPDPFSAIHAADLTMWDGNATDPRLLSFLGSLRQRLRANHETTDDAVHELALLPPIQPLPEEDKEATEFLADLRQVYLRSDLGLADLDGAMALTLESPLTDLCGETPHHEVTFDALCDFFADADSDLILDDDQLLVWPDDFRDLRTIGQLADLVIRRRGGNGKG